MKHTFHNIRGVRFCCDFVSNFDGVSDYKIYGPHDKDCRVRLPAQGKATAPYAAEVGLTETECLAILCEHLDAQYSDYLAWHDKNKDRLTVKIQPMSPSLINLKAQLSMQPMEAQ